MILAIFHSFGSLPSRSEQLKIAVSGGASRAAWPFKTQAGVLSGPDALFVLILHRALKVVCIYSIICLKSVDVRRMQFAILAQSPREMALTDRILPRYFLSRVRVSILHRIFLYAKKPQTSHPLTDRPGRDASAPPTVRTAQFEKQLIPSRQVATYVRGGYG